MKTRLLLSLLALSSFLVKAQTPEYYNSNASSVINNYPLNNGTNNKAQWIYGPQTFNAGGTGIGAPAYSGNITKIWLKLGNSVSFNNYTNITVSLSQNVSTSTSFGTTAASAYSFVTGMTPCFYQASGYNLTGGVANSWFAIPLSSSFPYNPNLSLVVEIKVSGGAGNNISLVNTTAPCRLFGGYGSTVATTAVGVANMGISMIATPLPASILHFDGQQQNSSDVLSWTTGSELNNAYFNLQHSTDGINFTTIEKVNSTAPNGNSNVQINYQAINNKPVAGHNYYRLEQVDINGAISLSSEVVDLKRSSDNSISIYPNPAKNSVNVELSMTKISNLHIIIRDLSGKIVKQEKAISNIGMNLVPVDIQHLNTGMYMLEVMVNDKSGFTTNFRKD